SSSNAIGQLNLAQSPAETTTTLRASAATAVVGQTVTLTATVTALAGGVGTNGIVNFYDGHTLLTIAPPHPNGQAPADGNAGAGGGPGRGEGDPREGHLPRQHLGGRGRDRQSRRDRGRRDAVGQPGRPRPVGDLHGHGDRRRPGGRHANRHGDLP